MYAALEIARYFVSMTDNEAGEGLTNLKLQKLLYYAQGIHLAITGKPLFQDVIEAWQHGPVVASVFHRFKSHGANPIPPDGCGGFPAIDEETREILDDVFSVFGQFSAWKLRNMTHDEPPWRDTPQGEAIGHGKLQDYFKTQVTIDEQGTRQEAVGARRQAN